MSAETNENKVFKFVYAEPHGCSGYSGQEARGLRRLLSDCQNVKSGRSERPYLPPPSDGHPRKRISRNRRMTECKPPHGLGLHGSAARATPCGALSRTGKHLRDSPYFLPPVSVRQKTSNRVRRGALRPPKPPFTTGKAAFRGVLPTLLRPASARTAQNERTPGALRSAFMQRNA